MISELGIGITPSIFGLALNAFWKRAIQFINKVLGLPRMILNTWFIIVITVATGL